MQTKLSSEFKGTPDGMEADLHTQLDDEARTIGRIGDTADAREAIAAFLDKRPPTFSA